MALLEIYDLHCTYRGSSEATLRNCTFSLQAGESLGILGRSGSGKSTLLYSILGSLMPNSPVVCTGDIIFQGKNLHVLSDKERTHFTNQKIRYLQQDSMSGLHPLKKIRRQIKEALSLQKENQNYVFQKEPLEIFYQLELPESCLDDYPYQLSGGMRQRLLLGLNLIGDLKLLLIDEPTTGLDLMVKIKTLQILKRLQKGQGFSIIMVSHDLDSIHKLCQRTAVMKSGRIVELGNTAQIFSHPKHSYSTDLIMAQRNLEDYP